MAVGVPEHVVLGREVVLDGADRDAGAGGDRADARTLQARLGDDLEQHLGEACAALVVVDRGGCHTSVWYAGGMAPATFTTQHRGQQVAVVPDSLWERDRIRLLVDGEEVAETKANGPKTVLAGEDFEIRAVTPLWGGSVLRAELVPADGGEPLRLEPEPGTRAARRARFEREHPRLYAARHVVKGAAQVAVALIGLSLLLRFLPSIPLPDIDLPRLDLPDIPWPDIPLPHLEVPQWLQEILKSKPYWLPVVIGIFVARAELRRRSRKVPARDDRD